MYRDYEPPKAPSGLPEIPGALQELLLRVLSPEPVERPDSSREFRDGLRKIRRDRGQARLPSSRRSQEPSRGRPAETTPRPSPSVVAKPAPAPALARSAAPPPPTPAAPPQHSPFRQTPPMLGASKLLCRLSLNLPDATSPSSSVRWWLSTQLPSDARLEQRSSTVWWAILQVASETAADKLGRGMQDAANMQFGDAASIEWKVVQH